MLKRADEKIDKLKRLPIDLPRLTSDSLDVGDVGTLKLHVKVLQIISKDEMLVVMHRIGFQGL